MTTLADIEATVERLNRDEKERLFFYLVAHLRGDSETLPEPRDIPRELISSWIAEDEADYRAFRQPPNQ